MSRQGAKKLQILARLAAKKMYGGKRYFKIWNRLL